MRQRARRGILRRSAVRWLPHCTLIVNAVLEHVPRCTAEAGGNVRRTNEE